MEKWRFKAKFYLFVIYVSQSVHCRVTELESMRKKWSWRNMKYIYGV